MTFRIVPKGTKGAIPLREALDIQRRRLGIPVYTDESRARISRFFRNAHRTGVFADAPAKQAAALRNYHGKPARGRRE